MRSDFELLASLLKLVRRLDYRELLDLGGQRDRTGQEASGLLNLRDNQSDSLVEQCMLIRLQTHAYLLLQLLVPYISFRGHLPENTENASLY